MLTKRLAACAALVTKGGVLCDVGTDHAYLPAELLRLEYCPRAVVTDLHAGPLDAARRTLSDAGVLSRATLYLCDGLTAVPPEGITDVTIAGVGGETVVHILEMCAWCRQVHLILQPMTKIPTLRSWLASQGFDWTEQIVLEHEKFYTILDVQYAGTIRVLTALEREIGRLDWQLEPVRQYGSWRRQRLLLLVQQLQTAGLPQAAEWGKLVQEIDAAMQEGSKEC